MSSLRNSIQRRAHRERAQPFERQRLGLLEKKKDYQKRARDYNKKKAVLKSLRQKAAERNEDEFYFGMMSRKGPGNPVTRGKSFTGTVDGDRGNKAMDMDTVRLLKTQDLGYVRTMRNVAAKEVRELEERFILAGGTEQADDDDDDNNSSDDDMGPSVSRPQKTKKIVFFDGAEEREQALRQEAEKEADAMEDAEDEDGEEAAEARRKAQNVEKLRKRLKAARKKLKTLKDAEYELELQQAKMAKTATSTGVGKDGRINKVRQRKR
ncbi:79bacd3b-d226-47dd-9f9e-595229443693 [Thermothielavioides terrestris]|uniref:U3 small nucleolar RNA-associated protein 11 n=1 Tax=Thermothielavioides terrestris TaxID=2587410 RepID=A0A446B8E6_9PEZI|nr:79bacd3b-d226-47dd-9f9e-595229443693 [Thermothielavioides terrestris]